MVTPDEMIRILGAFWGQLVGDALGSRYEFLPAPQIKQMLEKDIVNDHLPMLGGGKFRKYAGQITDDGEMALSLAQSLINCKKFNQADVASSYSYWASTDPPDIGMATYSALSKGSKLINGPVSLMSDKQKEGILNETLIQARDSNQNSLSNGILIRISPLAIALRNLSEKKLSKAIVKECSITHQNPIAIEAQQFYVHLLVNLLKGQEPNDAIVNSQKHIKSQLILDLIFESTMQAIPIKLQDGKEINGDTACQGFLGVALQVSLFELRTSDSFEKSMIRIMGIGGDTDTNGCIAAVLLGARFGVDSIPKDWIETVLNAPIDRDFPFMEPLKNKTIDLFVEELASLS